jgi:hypothetical protein
VPRGCELSVCGFCGPREADDWARAIVASSPQVEVKFPMPGLLPPDIGGRMKRFISELRKRVGVVESVWWIERRFDPVCLVVRYLQWGSEWDLGDFRKLAGDRGLGRTLTSFRWREDAWTSTEWTDDLLDSTLSLPRAGMSARTYGAAQACVASHKEMNGRDTAHPSKNFFRDETLRRLTRHEALRAASVWRGRRGLPPRCASIELEQLDEDDVVDNLGRDVKWHDATWLADLYAFWEKKYPDVEEPSDGVEESYDEPSDVGEEGYDESSASVQEGDGFLR